MRIEEIVSTNRKVGLGFRHEPIKPSFHGHFPFYAPQADTTTTAKATTHPIPFTSLGNVAKKEDDNDESSTDNVAGVACNHANNVGTKLNIFA